MRHVDTFSNGKENKKKGCNLDGEGFIDTHMIEKNIIELNNTLPSIGFQSTDEDESHNPCLGEGKSEAVVWPLAEAL